jgi:hypothetical protein
MDLATVLGLADNPAELAGYGPIPASAARALAADEKWRRLICDPLTGALIDLGTTVYRPNAELERYRRSRDARCSFPSCHQPAHRCEVDHTNPYRPGQPATGTDRCNLGCLCEYRHDLKHYPIAVSGGAAPRAGVIVRIAVKPPADQLGRFDWPDYDDRYELWSTEMAPAENDPCPF